MKKMLKNPDVSKREFVDIGEGGCATSIEGTYNPNLTMQELCLLRSMIWENRENRAVITAIHQWMFHNKDPKKVRVFSDIINCFEGNGQEQAL